MKMTWEHGDLELTTEHAMSSYGCPVLLVHGRAHGPDDIVPASHNNPAHASEFIPPPWRMDDEQQDSACKFLGQSPRAVAVYFETWDGATNEQRQRVERMRGLLAEIV
jgi:hypothetical protein